MHATHGAVTRRDPAGVATPAAGADEPSAVFDEVHRRLFEERELDVTVGRYRLLHPIGGGGFGCVFRAHDPELDRLVAIKLLRRDRGDDADLLQEARALARFRHPNVVSVFDVGRYDLRGGLDTPLADCGVFVVMELVPGEALSTWLDEPRSWRRVIAAFDQAAAGLAAAHAIGLVHRDVKPGNILIEPDGHVRVTDFGLARGVVAELDDAVAGTPAFMAPEQLDGHADARADQYGLCVALYLALAGHLPFTSTDVEAMRAAKYAGTVVARAAPRAVPRRIWDAVLRGLSPRAEDRFVDLQALRAAIDPSRGDRRRRRVAIAAGAAALAGLAITTRAPAEELAHRCDGVAAQADTLWPSAAATELAGAAPLMAARVDGAMQTIVAEWRVARIAACEGAATDPLARARELCLDRQLDDVRVAVELLRHADRGVLARLPEVLETIPRAEQCEGELATMRGPASAASAAARAELVRVDALVAAGALDEAEAVLAGTDEGGDPALVTARMHARGLIAHERGLVEEWLALDREALAQATEHGDDATAARIELSFAAYLAHTAEDPIEARLWLDRGEASLRRAGQPRALASAAAYTRGAVARVEGDHEEADRQLGLALLHGLARMPMSVTSVSNALGARARAAMERGDTEAALATARDLSGFVRTMHERDDASVLLADDLLADALARAGDVESATALRRENLARWRLASPQHPGLARDLALVAASALRHDDDETAATMAAEAEAIMIGALGPEHFGVVRTQVLVQEIASVRDPEAALVVLGELCTRAAALRAARGATLSSCLAARAAVLRALDRRELAIADLEAALAAADQRGSQHAVAVGHILLELAELELDGGHTLRASQRLDAARALGDAARGWTPWREALLARLWNDLGQPTIATQHVAAARAALPGSDAATTVLATIELEDARAHDDAALALAARDRLRARQQPSSELARAETVLRALKGARP